MKFELLKSYNQEPSQTIILHPNENSYLIKPIQTIKHIEIYMREKKKKMMSIYVDTNGSSSSSKENRDNDDDYHHVLKIKKRIIKHIIIYMRKKDICVHKKKKDGMIEKEIKKKNMLSYLSDNKNDEEDELTKYLMKYMEIIDTKKMTNTNNRIIHFFINIRNKYLENKKKYGIYKRVVCMIIILIISLVPIIFNGCMCVSLGVTILYYALLIIFYILFDRYLKKYILNVINTSVKMYSPNGPYK
ncbi:Hypotetical protein [Plasmodium sp. DRC-Itaito]|nr:Hypotetical protein [Plasmodium sp. DRC-Itaito]